VADAAALYLRLVAARVRSQFQYRTSFALDFVGVFLVTFLDFAAILVIFENVPQLGGWRRLRSSTGSPASPSPSPIWPSVTSISSRFRSGKAHSISC
jgi:hypothetical protein